MEKTPLEEWIINKINCKEPHDLRKQIDEYQLKKIKENIDYVKEKSIFYKEHLKKVSSEKINSLSDFKNVPFTDPQHIRTNPMRFLCVSQQYIKRIVSLNTSGTSGITKRIYFTKEDQELTIDFFEKGMSGIVKAGDKTLILLPGENSGSVGDLLNKALAKLKVESYIYGPVSDYCAASKMIKDNNITCVIGIPIQILNLKRKCNDIFNKFIRKILLSTDYVPEIVIKELSFPSCNVFTHYGMTEMGFGGGVECEALDGYHMREADLYFEIINPQNKEPVRDGEYGEIVFTTLTRKGMPLIRYRTGDIGRFKDKPCICGTVLKTMERVCGRMENDIILSDGGHLSMRDLDEVLLKWKQISDFTADVYTNDGKKDIIIIKIQITENNLESIKNQVNEDLCKIPSVCACIKKGKAEIILQPCKHNIDTGNGRLKRKIYDHRKKG